MARYVKDNVESFFRGSKFLSGNPQLIHSMKSRVKDPGHLRDKLIRKSDKYTDINEDNYQKYVTDLAGIRLLHLYPSQIGEIHSMILANINEGNWILHEEPKAYTWDPEVNGLYEKFEINTEKNSRSYTSVHYVVRMNDRNFFCCEIQVRTLFEEAWGELDHAINYPNACEINSCKESLLVLSKIVNASTRLSEALMKDYISKA